MPPSLYMNTPSIISPMSLGKSTEAPAVTARKSVPRAKSHRLVFDIYRNNLNDLRKASALSLVLGKSRGGSLLEDILFAKIANKGRYFLGGFTVYSCSDLKMSIDLWSLFMPRYCVVCNNVVWGKHERFFCLSCYSSMPFSRGGRLEEYLRKRMSVDRAFSLLDYTKGSGFAEVFKEIKYRDNAELALFMGRLMGYKLLSVGWPKGLTFVPIPMTRLKRLRRGYNQAELLARGISQVMGGKLELDLLVKSSNTVSQTLMGRWERWVNSKGIYSVFEGRIIEKNLVLVDDIVTTGATIDSCRLVLESHYDVKVWVIALGFTP